MEKIIDINKKFIEYQSGIKFDSKADAEKYFLKRRDLDPNSAFNSELYLAKHQDVLDSGVNPYIHYLEYGKKEGRAISDSEKYSLYKMSDSYSLSYYLDEVEEKYCSLFFDINFYKNKYPGVWGWDHYINHGQYENKSPSKDIIPEVLDKYFRDEENILPLAYMIDYIDVCKEKKFNDNPDISVVILNWNKSLMTIQCVLTLIKNSSSKQLEIIIVDNGSQDGEFAKLIMLRKIPCVKIIRNKTNRYYGEANNIGVENSRSENICLLNNDAFVGIDWDKHLLNELYSDANIGGVGPKFLFPNGTLQEAGGVLNPCGQNVQIGKGLNPKLKCFNRTVDVTHISAACFLLKRATFDRVNGFDYRYEPAYYEDADLTAKISLLGMTIRYVPAAEVIHVENATSKDKNIGFDFGSLVSTNRFKFVERWGDYLRGGDAPFIPDFTGAYKKQYSASNAKVAVVYSPYNLTPGGGERYILSLALAARDNGYVTYFCSPEKYSKYRFHTVAFELGLEVNDINLIAESDLDSMDISLFIAMSNELSPSIKAKGNDKNIYHCQFPFPMSDWHKTNCLDNASDYDLVVVNSEFTKKAYQAQSQKYNVKIPDVKVVSPPVELVKKTTKPNDKVIRILNVGRFIAGGHCKKQVELSKAFSILSKELKRKGIECKMTFMGSLGANEEDRIYLNKIREASSDEDVEIILNAPREQVIKKYQESDFYWHGTGIGENVTSHPEVFEHFGITPVEAMSSGSKVIVWMDGGPAEIIKSVLPFEYQKHLAKTINDYAKLTLDLISENDVDVNLSSFSESEFLRNITNLIKGY